MGKPKLSQKTDQLDEFDQFLSNLRQALEHVTDAEWLKDNSPLESMPVYLAARALPPAPAFVESGIKYQDDALRIVWKDWETHPRSGLQSLLWSSVRQVPPEKDIDYKALLLLTYFQDPRPRQADLIKALAMGQSTYYRQLNAAVGALERTLLTYLQPSLHLEWPGAKPLVGRDDLLLNIMATLRDGGFVNLVGPSGLGKTSLGAAIAHRWGALSGAMAGAASRPMATYSHPPAFWYTFRRGLTDNLQQLIYAIALFLHEQGAPDLWLHLITRPEDLGPVKTMAMIRKGLEEVRSTRLPLFCFDEVDVLLPGDLDDDEQHAQLRAWLEEFTAFPRSGTPVLFIGQRLLLEPEPGRSFTLQRFGLEELSQLLQAADISATPALLDGILAYTRGNPLLIQLLVTLHRIGEPVLADPSRMTSSLSLDWFVTRLRRHLSNRELELLDAISVYETPAPADIWRKQTRALGHLIQLGLVDRSSADQITIPGVLRDALYRQLPSEARTALHLSAAQDCAARGAYSLAAHHFVLGQQPAMAVWTYYKHREQERQQGQSQTMLRMLEPLRLAELPDERDRRALSIVLSELYYLSGKHEEGMSVLETVHWHPHRTSTARVQELRGKLLAMRGDIDSALAEYRASLDTLSNLSPAQPVMVRAEIAQQAFWRARDPAVARREARLAKQDVEMLLGDIEAEAGHADRALHHYEAAMDAAQQDEDPVRMAKLNEAVGIVEARRLNVEGARRHLETASRYYASYGNIICSVGVTKTNMAYACLLARRYADAMPPAEEAITFFSAMNQPYWLSLNEANLAEAAVNLGRHEQAEMLAWRALAREEAAVRPYCLYVLGHVRRIQGQWPEGERFCREALDAARANGDLWASGPAWRVLGEIYADWNKLHDAHAAFHEALQLYEQLGVPQEVEMLNAKMNRIDNIADEQTPP